MIGAHFSAVAMKLTLIATLEHLHGIFGVQDSRNAA